MSALDNTPGNKNFLSPLNFTFMLKRAPHVNFFIQKINLPAIYVPTINIPTPFVRIPFSGEILQYSDLMITFKVDEDLTNYMEIRDWINGLASPEEYNQYSNLASNESYTGNGITSDMYLMILSSAKNPTYTVTFQDAFPVGLSELNFNTTSSYINFLEVTATFRYLQYSIKKAG